MASGISSSHGALAGNTTKTKTYGAGTNNEWSSGASATKSTVVDSPKDDKPKQTQQPVTPSVNTNNGANNAVTDNTWNGGTESEWNDNFGYDDESNDYWDEYLAYQKQVEAAQKAAIEAAVQQNVNTLNAQKDTTSQDYADAYRQLYLNKMKSNKNINQQMAAQGVTGGASESTLLGLNTNYEDNLRQGKVAEQNALSALDQAIANAQLSGSIEAANAAATTGQNTANAYLTAWQQQLAADQAAAQLEASQNSENRGYAYQLALSMMQSGTMPSDELLLNAGISKSDANTIVANYVADKVGSGGGYTGGYKTGNDTTYNQYKYTNNLGSTANENTANAKGELKNDYQSVLSYLKSNINSSSASDLRNFIDNSYRNDYITGTQQAALHKYLTNNTK